MTGNIYIPDKTFINRLIEQLLLYLFDMNHVERLSLKTLENK